MLFLCVALVNSCGLDLFPTGDDDQPSTPTKPQYVIQRVSSSGSCSVRESTASPIGETLATFNSRAEASSAMCGMYDPSMSQSSKCWTFSPVGTCR